jgi:cytochrome c553
MRKVEAIFVLTGVAVAAFVVARSFHPTPVPPEPVPGWAYPVPPPPSGPAAKLDNTTLKSLPGSKVQFTEAGANTPGTPADWYPEDHPPMPQVVAHARKPQTYACAYCHLPNGQGRPENASLAGQPAAYLFEQVMAIKDGHRKTSEPRMGSIRNMVRVAQLVSPEDARTAADYFSKLKYRKWIRVVETDSVPKFQVDSHNMAMPLPSAGSEPLGSRIIEMPEDVERVELRDSHSGFVAYVPKGAIARGERLVKSGNGAAPCSSCHGPSLKGVGNVPALAGRSPITIVRQLYDIRHGTRTGDAVEPMKAEVAHMTAEDRIDIAAYLASLTP